MSKVDALRAMREARYAQQAAGTPAAARRPQPTEAAATTAKPARAKPARAKPADRATEAAEPATDELCGHRNMSGRTCTRERGHSAKSHRYS